MNKRAVSLIEVTLACLILTLAIIPLVTSSQHSAKKAIETEKIQMAERILESIKTEMMTMQFNTFYERAELEQLDKNSIGPFPLTDGYYPVTLVEVLKIQQKYKDFSIDGNWSWNRASDGKPDKTMINVEVTCSFTETSTKDGPIVRKKSFLIIKP